MANNLPSMFQQLRGSIRNHPSNSRNNQGVEGMPESPMDNMNPLIRQFSQGTGNIMNNMSEAVPGGFQGDYQTSQQKATAGNQAVADAMDSDDPQMLMKAAALMMQQGNTAAAQRLTERADRIRAAGKTLLEEGQAEIEAGASRAGEQKDLKNAIGLSIRNKDKDWTDMLKTGAVEPSEYFKHLSEISTHGGKKKAEKDLEGTTASNRYSVEWKGDKWWKIDSLGIEPPAVAAAPKDSQKDRYKYEKRDGGDYLKIDTWSEKEPEVVNFGAPPNTKAAGAELKLTTSRQIARVEKLLSTPVNNWVAFATKGIDPMQAGSNQTLLDEVIANLTLDKLVALKLTGATLGQITKVEFEALGNALTSLNQADPRYLDKLREYKALLIRARTFSITGNELDLVDLNDEAGRQNFYAVKVEPKTGKFLVVVDAPRDGEGIVIQEANQISDNWEPQ